MKFLVAAAALFSLLAPASAAPLGPTAQTLEAIHGTAVNDPARFFDGMDSRVNLLEPTAYAPLPAVAEEKPAETRFDSREIAPGLTLHEPVPPSAATAVPPVRDQSARGGSPSLAMILAVCASVALAAALLLIFL
ncbi:MAG: hypothetical protein ACHQ51_10490 [Elusimicrobiota bacterium]